MQEFKCCLLKTELHLCHPCGPALPIRQDYDSLHCPVEIIGRIGVLLILDYWTGLYLNPITNYNYV